MEELVSVHCLSGTICLVAVTQCSITVLVNKHPISTSLFHLKLFSYCCNLFLLLYLLFIISLSFFRYPKHYFSQYIPANYSLMHHHTEILTAALPQVLPNQITFFSNIHQYFDLLPFQNLKTYTATSLHWLTIIKYLNFMKTHTTFRKKNIPHLV